MLVSFDEYVKGCMLTEASTTVARRTIRGPLTRRTISMLKKLLRHNIVTFKFVKRDGTIRRAKGTLHPDFLPALRGGAPKVLPQLVYYDFDKHHWRSFRTFKFIKIMDIKEITSSTISSLARRYDEEDDDIISNHEDEEVRETEREREDGRWKNGI